MKQQSIFVSILMLGVSFVPFVSDAVTLAHTLNTISGIINAVIPIVLAITVLFFFWGLAMYMMGSSEGSDLKIGKGINIMIMGIIAIFVMVSIWGIIRVLQQTFKVDQSRPIIPDVIQRGYGQ